MLEPYAPDAAATTLTFDCPLRYVPKVEYILVASDTDRLDMFGTTLDGTVIVRVADLVPTRLPPEV